ncbi:MAG TPA: hypothetical protein VGD22_06210 [Sphingobacteriaceae bacterium]
MLTTLQFVKRLIVQPVRFWVFPFIEGKEGWSIRIAPKSLKNIKQKIRNRPNETIRLASWSGLLPSKWS